ncbi:MAG: hypothetical protein Q4F13_08865 [Pseudomonadota bacterium]|nr:hypothetical protein [Pseudomonadota bacterium]
MATIAPVTPSPIAPTPAPLEQPKQPTASPGIPPTAPVEKPPAPRSEVEQKADEILRTGDRFLWADDYDARLDAFAQAMHEGDPQFREDLLAEIAKRDPGAFSSWLTPERINNLTDQGRISQVQRDAIAEGVAGAYNAGKLASHQNINPQTGEPAGTYSVLDAWMQPSGYTDGADSQVANARAAHEFAELFNRGSKNSTIDQFRKNFGTHLIRDYVANDSADPAMRSHSSVMAAALLNGNSNGGEITADALNGLSDDEFKDFMRFLGSAAPLYTAEHLQNLIGSSAVALRDNLKIGDVALDDQFAGLFKQVASVGSDSAAAQEAAVRLARLPASEPRLFDSPARANALGDLFTNHSRPILDKLTDYNTDHAGSVNDPDKKAYMQNASELGSLLKLTLYNPDMDAGKAQSLRNELVNYAAELKEVVNKSQDGVNDAAEAEAGADAIDRLSMLLAASSDAITQGFQDIKDKQDAQKAMVGFIADIALAGIPLGDKAKNAVGDMLGEVFNNPDVSKALKNMSGQVIDQATGKLTEAAKQELAKVLGEDGASMLDQQSASNALNRALPNGVNDSLALSQITGKAETIATGINTWRK